MNYFQDGTHSDASTTQNSMYCSSSVTQTTPPLSSTPTFSAAPPPISVPPLRPKKILSMGAQEFVPTTPASGFKHHTTGNDNGFQSALNQRQRCGYNGGNTTLPLNISTHCSLLNTAAQNQLFLRQQQILQERQQLLHKQQQEYAAATIAKQQFVLSAAAVANHPQDEISNSLKMFAVLSACKGNETQPSPDEVMQDFATNGYTTDDFNRYQQYQAASNMQTFANSNMFPNISPHLNQSDYNMNVQTSSGYFNYLYQQQQLLQENTYNELLRQNFLNLLPQHLVRQAEMAAVAAAAVKMEYNNQNLRPKKNHFKKESQVTVKRCVFCENNNEPDAVVRSHAVRDSQGRVLCPKLRIYVCPICGASGDDAHTVKYCPQKPIVTMEEVLKADSTRTSKTNFIQKPSQMQV